jgi:hypothetical protein
MRVWHIHTDKVYNIEAVLQDDESGLEYLILHVSEGIRQKGEILS